MTRWAINVQEFLSNIKSFLFVSDEFHQTVIMASYKSLSSLPTSKATSPFVEIHYDEVDPNKNHPLGGSVSVSDDNHNVSNLYELHLSMVNSLLLLIALIL